MAITDLQSETNQPQSLPSYEHLLLEQYGSDTIARNRAAAQATPELGNPNAALSIGMIAPAFTLVDSSGTLVSLANLMAEGPVVIIFYRGGWCPFCNVYLRAFQLARPRIRALGAQVVLISPQLPEHAQALGESQNLLFPLLNDLGNRVARQYGLVFQMSEELRAEYLAEDIDLTTYNGDERWELPMPATFVIDRTGVIQYAFVSADYTQRADPSVVLNVLQRLKQRH